VVTLSTGDGLYALEIGAGRGLGHGDRAHHLAARHAWEPVALLFLAAMDEDVSGDDALDAGAEVDTCSSEFIQNDDFVGKSSPAAPILLRHIREQHPYRAGLGPGFRIGAVLLAPTSLLWHKFSLDELTNRLAE
jgi:hypothetical protein